MNYYGTYYTHSSNELYHFGVAGMKWGVRKADSTSNKSGKSSGKTPEQKAAAKAKAIKAVKVGAVVAGAALATYGAYKLSKYAKGRSAEIGAKKCNELLRYSEYRRQDARNAQLIYRGDILKFKFKPGSKEYAESMELANKMDKLAREEVARGNKIKSDYASKYGTASNPVNTFKALSNVYNDYKETHKK